MSKERTIKELNQLYDYVTADTADKTVTDEIVMTALKFYRSQLRVRRSSYGHGAPYCLELELKAVNRAIKTLTK